MKKSIYLLLLSTLASANYANADTPPTEQQCRVTYPCPVVDIKALCEPYVAKKRPEIEKDVRDKVKEEAIERRKKRKIEEEKHPKPKKIDVVKIYNDREVVRTVGEDPLSERCYGSLIKPLILQYVTKLEGNVLATGSIFARYEVNSNGYVANFRVSANSQELDGLVKKIQETMDKSKCYTPQAAPDSYSAKWSVDLKSNN